MFEVTEGYFFDPSTGDVTTGNPHEVYFTTSQRDVDTVRELCEVRERGFQQGISYAEACR